MRLKRREKDTFFSHVAKAWLFLVRVLFGPKGRRLYRVLFSIGLLLLGLVAGLVLSGYFGTFDQPSQRAYTVLSGLGINNLHDLNVFMEGIVKQNIRIPYNLIVAQFSRPEKFFFDIKFTNLQKIEFKRQQALELGTLVTSGDDFVPAKLTVNDKTYDVDIRLKGDLPDHWNGDKWSLRVKVGNGEKINGIRVFSLQDPSTRQDLNEFVFQRALQLQDVIGVRYQFVEVVINGESKGVYALEEHFSKELVESNNRREGLILKFNEDVTFETFSQPGSENLPSLNFFYASPVDTFESTTNLVFDVEKQEQLQRATYLLDAFRLGKLKPSEVFDVRTTATYFAMSTLMNCAHGSTWHNMRFYFNPITSRIEPIGFDANCRGSGGGLVLLDYTGDCIGDACELIIGDFPAKVLQDEVIYKAYIEQLEFLALKGGFTDLLNTMLSEIDQNVKYLHKENPFYYFSEESYAQSANELAVLLNPSSAVISYLQEGKSGHVVLRMSNSHTLPVEVLGVRFEDYTDTLVNPLLLQKKVLAKDSFFQEATFTLPEGYVVNKSLIDGLVVQYRVLGGSTVFESSVLPWKYPSSDFARVDVMRASSNLSEFSFVEVYESFKRITIPQGSWVVDQDLIFPEGYLVVIEPGTTIDLVNNAMILSRSPIYAGAQPDTVIKIFSSDGTGQGLTVMQADGLSEFIYVEFSDMRSPDKFDWELSGTINVFESEVRLDHVSFIDLASEDSLNIIRSEFMMNNSLFKGCMSDCFDSDFCEGTVEQSTFERCGNDCLDFSGSNITVNQVLLQGAGDKAISVGEKSNAQVKQARISGDVYIGVASKDFSTVTIKDSSLSEAMYGLAAYQKKQEYGPSMIVMENTNLASDITQPYLIERGSTVSVDNNLILGSELSVFDILYDEE